MANVPHMYSAPPQLGGDRPRGNFVKMFDAGKTSVIQGRSQKGAWGAYPPREQRQKISVSCIKTQNMVVT